MRKPLKLPLANAHADNQRREKQAQHFVRIIRVHHLTRSADQHVSGEVAQTVADKIGCSSRTVYRDIKVLRDAYEILGTNKLDG